MHRNRTAKHTDLSGEWQGPPPPHPPRWGFIRKWLRFFEPATPARDDGGTQKQAADLEALRVENTKRASSLFNRWLPFLFFLGVAFATGLVIAVIAFNVVLVRMAGSARLPVQAIPWPVYAGLGVAGPASAAAVIVKRRRDRRTMEPAPKAQEDDSAVAS